MRNVLIGVGLLGCLLVLVWAMAQPPVTASVPASTKGLTVTGEPLVTRPGNNTTLVVAGRVKNEAQRPYSGQVTVTLFGADGKIVGTADGAVNDVPAGDEVTYQAVGLVPLEAAWTRVEPKVTLQIPR